VDKQIIALLIPIAALAIPTSAIILSGLHKLAKLRIEEARARGGAGGEGQGDVAALRDEVAELRHELGEVQERLDFTERMLARTREEARLPRGE